MVDCMQWDVWQMFQWNQWSCSHIHVTTGSSDIWIIRHLGVLRVSDWRKLRGENLSRAPLSSQGILSKRDSTFHSVINICFSFLAWGMYCILMVCFHSSFCVFYPSLPPCLPLSHTQIRSPPSHSIDQRLVGVLDESYQQFTQFKASFKLLPFQSGTVLITDNSFVPTRRFGGHLCAGVVGRACLWRVTVCIVLRCACARRVLRKRRKSWNMWMKTRMMKIPWPAGS